MRKTPQELSSRIEQLMNDEGYEDLSVTIVIMNDETGTYFVSGNLCVVCAKEMLEVTIKEGDLVHTESDATVH